LDSLLTAPEDGKAGEALAGIGKALLVAYEQKWKHDADPGVFPVRYEHHLHIKE
jgi:hypothetical protein